MLLTKVYTVMMIRRMRGSGGVEEEHEQWTEHQKKDKEDMDDEQGEN